MKVQYPVVKNITIDKDVKYDIGYVTGEVIGFIQGDEQTPDKFVICDDKSGAFIKVNIGECYKFEENADS